MRLCPPLDHHLRSLPWHHWLLWAARHEKWVGIRSYQAAVIALGMFQQCLPRATYPARPTLTTTNRCRRSVICHYEAPTTVKGVAEANASNSALEPPAGASVSLWANKGGNDVLNNIHPSNKALFMLTGSHSSHLLVPSTADGILYLRVCEITRAHVKYDDDITVRSTSIATSHIKT